MTVSVLRNPNHLVQKFPNKVEKSFLPRKISSLQSTSLKEYNQHFAYLSYFVLHRGGGLNALIQGSVNCTFKKQGLNSTRYGVP